MTVFRRLLGTGVLFTVAACSDAPTGTSADASSLDHRRGERTPTSVVHWNRQGMALFRSRGGFAGRANSYLALAQYRAVLAAARSRERHPRPSLAGAAAGASVAVLQQFYPLDSALIDAALATQRAAVSGKQESARFLAGEAIGRRVAVTTLAQAATDNFGATSPGTPPVGAGYWVSSGAPIVRAGFGARPFFLRSQREIRRGPPPMFGSPAFLDALDEVRRLSDNRTPEQVALTAKWVPFSSVVLNGVATDLLDARGYDELQAAFVLAYANTAAFDAIIGCFDTKFAFWYIRPTQADARITLATALPNHPSYPSGHSCETGAFQGVLREAFPRDRRLVDSLATEASFSRVVGGLHYQFDGDSGLALGRAAARLALRRRGIE